MIPDNIKQLISKHNEQGMPKSQIANLLNVSTKSVYNVLNGTKLKPNISKRQKNDNLIKSNIKRATAAIIRTGKRVTAEKVLNKTTLNVSPRTITRYLSKLDYRYKNLPQTLVLTSAQKEKRVTFVKQWICDNINMKNVIFSDESVFSLDGNDNFKSWSRSQIVNRMKRPFGGGKLMIWGCMSSHGLLEIRKCNQNINSQNYCVLMESDIIPLLKSSINSKFIFQQDNARPHVSKYTLDMFRNQGVELLNWPPYSPDLSPIEYIWHILKNKVYDGHQFKSKIELWDRIVTEIEILKEQKEAIFKNLYDEIPLNMCKLLCTGGELVNK